MSSPLFLVSHVDPSFSRAAALPRSAQLGAVVAAACLVAFMSGCSSVPSKPPGVDESTRRPANDPARIEQLRSQLDGERLKSEQGLQQRTLEAHRRAASILTAAQAPVAVAARRDVALAGSATGNTLFTATFDTGSSQLNLSAEDLRQLVRSANGAPIIVVRGRTDADADNAVDARLARERAERMKEMLVAGGVAPNRIRTQYQAAGDFVADNKTPQGRELNRRVEVEFYGSLPIVRSLVKPASSGPLALNGGSVIEAARTDPSPVETRPSARSE